MKTGFDKFFDEQMLNPEFRKGYKESYRRIMSFEEDNKRFADDKHAVNDLMKGCSNWNKPGHRSGIGTQNLVKYMIEIYEEMYDGEEYIEKLITNLQKTLKDYHNRYED